MSDGIKRREVEIVQDQQGVFVGVPLLQRLGHAVMDDLKLGQNGRHPAPLGQKPETVQRRLKWKTFLISAEFRKA